MFFKIFKIQARTDSDIYYLIGITEVNFACDVTSKLGRKDYFEEEE